MAGQLFTKSDADAQFGPILESKQITADLLTSLLIKTSNLIMFNIIESKLVILGDKRTVLYNPDGAVFTDVDVFHAYSISVVKELLDKGAADAITVEQRKDVLSLSCGETTMEAGTICPPICW